MDRKTAVEIIHNPDSVVTKLPRTYRTYPDKLEPFWPEVQELLKKDSKLKAYALFESPISISLGSIGAPRLARLRFCKKSVKWKTIGYTAPKPINT